MKLLRILEFVYKNMKNKRSKIIVVIFGIIFAISLIISVFIWADTTETIVIQEFQRDTDYLFTVSTFVENTFFDIVDYINTNEFVKSVDLSMLSYSIFNVGEKNDTYRYYPVDDQENNSDPVIVSNTILTSNEAYNDNLLRLFDVDGNLPKRVDEIAITQNILDQLREVVNEDIDVGSEINMAIARRFPFIDRRENQLINFNLKKFDNFTISGIINYSGKIGLTEKLYHGNSLENLVLSSIDTIDEEDFEIFDYNGIRVHAMVEFKDKALDDAGIRGLIALYNRFETQVKSRYWYAVTDKLDKETNLLTDEFKFAFNSIYYYLPLIVLSLLMSDQASSILLADRRKQVEILKIKGATSRDLGLIMSIEFFIISIIGSILGVIGSVFLSAFIPSITESGKIDWYKVKLHLNAIEIDFTTVYFSLLVIVGIFIISSMIKINKIINNSNNKVSNINLQNIFSSNIRNLIKLGSSPYQLIKLISTIILTSIVLILSADLNIDGITEISQDQTFRLVLSLIIITFNILWLFIFQYLSELVFIIIASFHKFIRKVTPKKSLLIIKNLQTKKNYNKMVVFYILFLLTLITMTTALISTYSENIDTTQIFLQGADLRIHTRDVYGNFSDVLENIDGIDSATGIYRTSGRIVGAELTIYAVDPSKYLEIGYWQYSKMEEDISKLHNLENETGYNIFISSRSAFILNYNAGDTVYMAGLERTLVNNLTIQGTIDSAPGLGISSGSNLELGQKTDGWAMLSYSFLDRRFNISNTDLFLAKVSPDADIDKIKAELTSIDNIIEVNPEPIAGSQILDIVNEFLPSTIAILFLIKLLSFIFSIVLLSLILDTVLKKREEEVAILHSIGNTKRHILRAIQFEFIIISSISVLLAVFLGVIMAKIILSFFIQFTIKRIFIPIEFNIDIVQVVFDTLLFLIIFYILFLIKIREIVNRASIWS